MKGSRCRCGRGEPSPGAGGSGEHIASVAAASPVPMQMWQRQTQSRCKRGSVGPSPGADVAAVRPVPVHTWQRRAESRCRCGSGAPSPGADVAAVRPSPGADVAAVRPSPGEDVRGEYAGAADGLYAFSCVLSSARNDGWCGKNGRYGCCAPLIRIILCAMSRCTARAVLYATCHVARYAPRERTEVRLAPTAAAAGTRYSAPGHVGEPHERRVDDRRLVQHEADRHVRAGHGRSIRGRRDAVGANRSHSGGGGRFRPVRTRSCHAACTARPWA
jgi:hypothetical protein